MLFQISMTIFVHALEVNGNQNDTDNTTALSDSDTFISVSLS